jgi:hypothetical protein
MALGASGRVSRMFPREELTYISLEGLDPGVTPKDGYFLLRKNHPNYNALYSLALVAAVNRYPTIEVFVETEVKGSPLEALLDAESYRGLMQEAQEKLQQFCTGGGEVVMPMDAFIINATKS